MTVTFLLPAQCWGLIPKLKVLKHHSLSQCYTLQVNGEASE